MKLLPQFTQRSAFNTAIYNLLNVVLAVTLFTIIITTGSITAAIILVLLSKWRTLAVRPRYWVANIQANLVDLIVGISYVALTYGADGSLWLQIILTMLYVSWLLILKPRSRSRAVKLQALVAVFFGVSAAFFTLRDVPVFVIVGVMYGIGYASARHVLGVYREVNKTLYSAIWGLVIAELGWLGYHWTLAYSVPGLGALMLAQIALICTVLSFAAERLYVAYHHQLTFRSSEIGLPVTLSISLILILVLFLNETV